MHAPRGLIFLVLLSSPALCQPAFDIADIHATPVDEWSKTPAHNIQGGYLIGDRYELHRATMLDLIHIAYGVDADKIYGGPNWLDYDRFEIIAKTKPGTRAETVNLMLRTLLGDRFHLAVKQDTRPVPGFVLSKANHELKLKAGVANDTSAPYGCMTMPRMADGVPPVPEIQCHNATIAAFAQILRRVVSPPTGNAPLVDSTGIEGTWDFTVPAERLPGSPAVARPALLDALDKLGLKLEAAQVPQSVLAVESVNQRPTPNLPSVAASLPPLPSPEFEVASVKWPCGESNGTFGPRFETGGRVSAICVPIVTLIKQAWNLPGLQMPEGMPKWLADGTSTKYNVTVVAKAPAGIAPDPQHTSMSQDILNTMLRALLIDRYKMKVHYEDRPADTYTLVSVKPKLTKADPAHRTGCVRESQRIQGQSLIIRLVCQNMTMAQFAQQIPAYDRDATYPVLDSTGIEGAWDFTVTYDAYAGAQFFALRAPAPADAAVADPSGALTFAGAVEKELGLKLEMHKRPLPVLVIDRMEEKPIEN